MQQQPDQQLSAGTQIASYIVRRKIGSGGMGEVYLCDEPSLGRQVALKVLRVADQDAEATSRFLQEGKALAKLQHPNIVSVYGLGQHQGLLYIAMEYVQGLSLFTHSRDRKLSIPEMLDVFLDVAKGLDYAHTAGLVHRDIKPANILVDQYGRGKLIDFGIAKSVGADSGTEGVKTKTGVVIGTLNYIAPELFRGEMPSPLSDIYALGLCFFEMLTGRTPFRSESQFQTMEKIRARDLEIPENVQLMFPEEFWKVLHQMIAVEPSERTATATLAVERLRQIPLERFPKQWSAHVGTARIENLTELHGIFDSAALDLAERQFVLSVALLKKTEKGDSQEDAVLDSTRLIETTGISIPKEVLFEALSEYQRERDSLLTVRRSEKVLDLRVPEAAKPSPAIVTPEPVRISERVIGSPPPSPTVESPSNFKWSVGLALVGLLALGGLQAWRWQNEEKEREKQKLAEAEAQEKRKASRGEKVLPPVAQGLAMVVEPTSDAWPPVEWGRPQERISASWKWQVKSSVSPKEIAIQDVRVSEGSDSVDPNLEKFRVETHQHDGEKLTQRIGFEWYRSGYNGFPVKTSGSSIFGTVGVALIGEPERIFPLRKGKEVHFETTLKADSEHGLFPIFTELVGRPVVPSELKLRSLCQVGDQIESVVRTDCTYRTVTASPKIEIVSTSEWSVQRKEVISYRIKIVSTSDVNVEMHSIVGYRGDDVVENRMPSQESN